MSADFSRTVQYPSSRELFQPMSVFFRRSGRSDVNIPLKDVRGRLKIDVGRVSRVASCRRVCSCWTKRARTNPTWKGFTLFSNNSSSSSIWFLVWNLRTCEFFHTNQVLQLFVFSMRVGSGSEAHITTVACSEAVALWMRLTSHQWWPESGLMEHGKTSLSWLRLTLIKWLNFLSSYELSSWVTD